MKLDYEKTLVNMEGTAEEKPVEMICVSCHRASLPVPYVKRNGKWYCTDCIGADEIG